MLSKRLYMMDTGLSRIVIRIPAGLPESKVHAVPVHVHLDSTLPSPSAADNTLSIVVLLELFNHAEESPQDVLHLHWMQDATRDTVRAVNNLEADTTGLEF
ncbi:hypothetical protein PLICRDRAFT_180701 [Plicaturopsis crispa FD-325 SS-3]|uniref:Uncharacterized protein n=1 Tax=Plicaturopsis crispa FD-325 SS-3 TaxID=944288 RepID=A0A0C9SVM8_PLICR|nr:hypothetical protein PLICRDRAFT_180701 [Plicaturopsis crispa FD-325 SS-3]